MTCISSWDQVEATVEEGKRRHMGCIKKVQSRKISKYPPKISFLKVRGSLEAQNCISVQNKKHKLSGSCSLKPSARYYKKKYQK